MDQRLFWIQVGQKRIAFGFEAEIMGLRFTSAWKNPGGIVLMRSRMTFSRNI
jgi:hypothetical protein